MAYSSNVEQWRALVSKYFAPEDVDKALYVIQGESGGNPTIAGDGGNSIGLFQMNMGGGLGTGSTAEQLSDPEYNIRLAAQAVYGGSGWKPWGEGATYQGKPFGALGNNPYGGPANARTPVGGAVKPAPKPQAAPTNPSLGALLKLQGQPIKGTNRIIKSSPKDTVGETGDWATDTGAYWQAAQDIYAELTKYNAENDAVTSEDGAVLKWNPATEDYDIIDPVGTSMLQRAQHYEANLDRLFNARKNGLIDTGEGAASAYLASEQLKKANAAEDYGDFVQRVGDLVALEDVPIARAAKKMSLITADRGNRSIDGGPFNYQGAGFGTSGQPKTTDLQPIVKSMKSVLPKSAPAPYTMNPAAMEPQTPTTMKIPSRTPEEILAEYSGGVTPPPVSTAGAVATLPPQAPVPTSAGLPSLGNSITPQSISAALQGLSRWQNRIK